jgi:hypothetical protein
VKLDLARRDSNPSARGLDRQGQPLLQARTVFKPDPQKPRLPRRFFGIVEVNPDGAGRDMAQVSEENCNT